MSWHHYVIFALGYTWLLLTSIRAPFVLGDALLVRGVLRQAGYPGRTSWLLFRRLAVPGVLSAPVLLWLSPRDFFRRMDAQEAWETASFLVRMYGPPSVEPEEQEEEPEPAPSPVACTEPLPGDNVRSVPFTPMSQLLDLDSDETVH